MIAVALVVNFLKVAAVALGIAAALVAVAVTVAAPVGIVAEVVGGGCEAVAECFGDCHDFESCLGNQSVKINQKNVFHLKYLNALTVRPHLV